MSARISPGSCEVPDASRERRLLPHRITEADGRTTIDVTVDIDGPLGWRWRRILASDFRRSLQPDLDRLAATAEADVARTA